MDAAAVFALAQKNWGSDTHIWTDADLLLAGLTPAQMTKFKAAANKTDNRTGGAPVFLDSEIMTLIAFHESNFNERAHGVGPVDDSYGLWQINTLGPLWAGVKSTWKRAGGPGTLSKEDLYKPEVNVSIAHQYTTERPGGPARTFQPWTGSWQKAVRDIANGTTPIAVGNINPGNATPGIGSTNTTIPDMRGFIDMVRELIGTILDPSWWKRIGIGVLGGAVVLGAIVFYNKDTIAGTAQNAGKVAAVAA